VQKIYLWLKGHWFYIVAGALVLGSVAFGGKRLLASLAEWARKRADRRIVGDALSGIDAAEDAISGAQQSADAIAESVGAGASGVENAIGTAANLADGHHRIEDIVRELARRYGVDAPENF